MMKEGQLLDDFALINAFDQAISKYKKMHGKEFKNCSTNDVLADDISSYRDIHQNDNSNPEKVDSGKENGSHVFVEVEEEEAGNLETLTENEVIGSQISIEDGLEPRSLPPQNESQCYSSSALLDEYNMLYKQYYEIEEQRQKILQKMQQFSDEYYPEYVEPSVSGVQWGDDSAAQQRQDASQTPCGTMTVSCCPCACQCSAASSVPLNCPITSAHGAVPPSTKGLEANTSVENVDFVAAALGAAERALSTLKHDTSGSEKENKLRNVLEQNADSETDLSTVLNAWYAAGLYTGKYLTEKSLAKKRHD